MFENKLNVWQGDGITNCLSYIRPNQRIKDLLKIRNSNFTDSYVAKVYHWTIDSKWTIKDSLRLGVDGMITNEVSHIVESLNDDEFKAGYHLATNDDDPFCVVRDFELQSIRQNYQNHKLINNLMITNYVMQSNEQPALTTSQTMKPKIPIINNNFETDNLIRTGNDFKRNSLTDFNFRQLISQLISYLSKRNTYDPNFRRFNLLGRNNFDVHQFSKRNDLSGREVNLIKL